MCDWVDREYRCGHHRVVAERWCQKYINSRRRCTPNITANHYLWKTLCGECARKHAPPVAWEYMIKRKGSSQV
ncbi:hypothetical protein RB594_006312 [Gaeumannomyces avenae]